MRRFLMAEAPFHTAKVVSTNLYGKFKTGTATLNGGNITIW
jgi:hypothetical protein